MLDGDVAGGGNDTIFKDFASLRPLGVQSHALKVSHLVAVSGIKKIAGRKTDVARLPKEKDKISDHAKVPCYLESIVLAGLLDASLAINIDITNLVCSCCKR